MLLLLIGFMAVGGILYANSIDNSFHFDDAHVIVNNEGIRLPSKILDIWTNTEHPGDDPAMSKHYRPLVYTSYMLNYAIGGVNPIGYNVVNLIIHILTAFLVALVIYQLTGQLSIGGLAGFLFLIHPFNAEAVNYVTARSSQLYALFYLIAFYSYVRYRSPSRPKLWLGIFLLSFIMSMLSKEMAVTLPLSVVAYEWLLGSNVRWQDKLRRLSIPIGFGLAVVISYMMIRKFLIGEVVPSAVGRNLVRQFATESVVLIRTIGLILWPANLTIDHQVEIYKTFMAWPVLGACIVLLFLFGLIFYWGQSNDIKKRIYAFHMVWFFSIVSILVVMPFHAVLQENRAYLATMGIVGLEAIGLVWVVERARTRGPVFWWGGWAGILVLVLIYGGLTIQRNVVWHDDLSLWTDAVQKEPKSLVSHDNLSWAYEKMGQLDRAAEHYRIMYSLDPNNSNIAFNLGVTALKQERYDEARKWYLEAIRLNPKYTLAYFRLGKLEELQNNWDKAVWAFSQAVRLSPDSGIARYRLADALDHAGRTGEAIREYEAAMEKGIHDQNLAEEAGTKLARLRGDRRDRHHGH